MLPRAGRRFGRYELYDEIAAGGMATVHVGRLLGPAGFTRTVALKRLHAQYAKDAEFVAAFTDEARIAARIRHPNVAQTLDVVAVSDELLLVMDLVAGESLAELQRLARARGVVMPPPIAVNASIGALRGLHAAHEATNDRGEWLQIVHRDVSPQNILVGADGVARVIDFGIAKAIGRLRSTSEGVLRGKAGYMAPEQIRGEPVDRRADVWAAGVVLWELLADRRLFQGDSSIATITRVLEQRVVAPSTFARDVPSALDAAVLRALSRRVDDRFATAREMSIALEEALAPASTREVEDWIAQLAGARLRDRAQLVAEIERTPSQPDARDADDAQPTTEPHAASIAPAPVDHRGDDPSHTGQLGSVSELRIRTGARRTRLRWVGLAVALSICGLLAFVALRGSPERRSSETNAATTSSITASLVATATPSFSSSALSSVATAAPSPLSVVDAGAPVKATVAPPKKKTTTPKPDCDPPWELTPNGTRKIKEACL